MSKILVTGAGGFIGSHLARELYSRGHFVRVVDIKWDGYLPEPYYHEKMNLDLRESYNCETAVRGMDMVYNLAADMGGIGYITAVLADIIHNNALINTHMIHSSMKAGIGRYFFSSSACIYPVYLQEHAEVLPLKEEDAYPADPNEPYGWEKLFTEVMHDAYGKDYQFMARIARFHNIYGQEGTYDGGKEKAPAALCRKVADASNPGTIEIWGDGKATRSFYYIDDCVRDIIMLTESDHIEPINIGSDRMVSVDELADIIIKISGKDIKKTYNLKAPQGVRGRNADMTKFRSIFGTLPEIPLEVGLKTTYEWIKSMMEK